MKPEETSDKMAVPTMRPVTPEDEDFLLQVYSSARADEMALVPWSAEQRAAFLSMQFKAQQLHYQKHNPEARHTIILLDGKPVGRLYVAPRASEIRILDITILPEHRNAGTGTALLKDLMDEAARAGKPVTIYVESYNPSQRLFKRLGFQMIEADGVNHLLEWRG